MHIHRIEDESGDLVDIIFFCSHYCHATWAAIEGVEALWDGCHETVLAHVCEHCHETIKAR